MTKDEIYEKLETEVKLRELSPKTYITYKNSIGLFLDWADKPYEGLEEIDFRNYLIYLVNRRDLSTSTINMYPQQKSPEKESIRKKLRDMEAEAKRRNAKRRQ